MRFNIFDIHLDDIRKEIIKIKTEIFMNKLKKMTGRMPIQIFTAIQEKPMPRQWFIPKPSKEELKIIDYVDLLQIKIK